MLFLTDVKNLAILLGLPLSFVLASVATITRWEAAAFAQPPCIDLEQAAVDYELKDADDAEDALDEMTTHEKSTGPTVTHSIGKKISLKVIGAMSLMGIFILTCGAYAVWGTPGICATGFCLSMGMMCSTALQNILGLVQYQLQRKADGTLSQRNVLSQGHRQVFLMIGLPFLAASLLPLSIYLKVSLFPVSLLYITTCSFHGAAILHKGADRGESFKWMAIKTCSLTALPIVVLAVIVTSLAYFEENKTREPQPAIEEDFSTYVYLTAVAQQGFQYVGQVGALVSALYRLDVKLSRTPRPIPSIESIGGRLGLVATAVRSLDAEHGPAVLVWSPKDMLTTMRKLLPAPFYAAVAGGTMILCIGGFGWAGKVIQIGLLKDKPVDWRKPDLQFMTMSFGAFFSPIPIVLSVYMVSRLRGETSFIFDSQADWSAGQDLSEGRKLSDDEYRELLKRGRN